MLCSGIKSIFFNFLFGLK